MDREILTEEDKKFIVDNYQKMSPMQIAVRLGIRTEGRKCPIVSEFISRAGLKPKSVAEEKVNDVSPPIEKIEDVAKKILDVELSIEQEGDDTFSRITTDEFIQVLKGYNLSVRLPLSEKDKHDIDFLLQQMEAKRFVLMYRSYRRKEYKELFKEEFIRALWGKGTMPQEEINDFIDLCNEMVKQHDFCCKIKELERMRESNETPGEQKLAIISLLSDLRDKEAGCAKRASDIKKTLGANREQRLKDSRPTGLTVMSIIESFQDFEKRQSLLKLQEIKDDELRKAAQAIDEMTETKALVMGVSVDELLQGGM